MLLGTERKEGPRQPHRRTVAAFCAISARRETPAGEGVFTRRDGRGSFTGILTYKNAENVRAAAKAQGLARLMIETDAPWLTPAPHRGKPNEPAFLRHTAEFAAKEVLGVSYEELAAVTTANARKFFGI